VFRVEESGLNKGTGLGAWGQRFRDFGSGFRVYSLGLGFRV